MGSLRRRFLLVVALLLATVPAHARVVDERFTLPVTIRHPAAGEVRHDVSVVVFRETERRRAPFLVLLHGRDATAAGRAAIGSVRYTSNSRYFVSLGFAVFVPTRIGYGVTGGPDLEETGSCNGKDYPPGYDAAAQLVAHARGLPYVEADRWLVVGQSFGGTTAITPAAQPPPGVRATVNFAGGGGGNPETRPGMPCRPDLLQAMFANYGRTARLPSLWLYSANDRYFGATFPRRWFDAFVAVGGVGRFVDLPAHGDDGHASFTRNTAAWRPPFEAFLAEAGVRIPG